MDSTQATAAMADALVQAGHMTREQIDAGMAQEQAAQATGEAITPGDAPAAQQPANTSAAPPADDPLAGYEIDPIYGPPQSADGYRFSPSLHQAPIESAHVQELQKMAFSLKLPPAIAQQFYSEAERQGSPMSSDEVTLLTNKTLSQAESWWPGKVKEMTDLGRRLIEDASKTSPRLKDFLLETGLGSHPVYVRQICEHAARVYSSPRRK